MVQKNLEIWNALRRTGREDIAIRSIISNTVQKIYPQKIEIISVKIHGAKILIRTDSQIANTELQLLEWDILEKIHWQLEYMGIKIHKNSRLRFT